MLLFDFTRKDFINQLNQKEKEKHEDKDTRHSAAGNLDSIIKIRSELHFIPSGM